MASERKVKVQKERKSRKLKNKEKRREAHKVLADIKREKSRVNKEVKEALGFDKFKFKKREKFILTGNNPCVEVSLSLDWNGVEM